MKKLMLIFCLSLGWCLPAKAGDINDFRGCVKNGTEFICSYVNPYAKNIWVKSGCDQRRENAKKFQSELDINEIATQKFKKYCDPTYAFPIEAKTMAEAVSKAKEQLKTQP